MAVTIDEVRKVAQLAKLRFTDDEMRIFMGQMNDILKYIDKLNELKTDNVQPASYSQAEGNVLREDKKTPCLSQEEALSNAPAKAHGHFKVPKVIG